jgi:hypothetical protein
MIARLRRLALIVLLLPAACARVVEIPPVFTPDGGPPARSVLLIMRQTEVQAQRDPVELGVPIMFSLNPIVLAVGLAASAAIAGTIAVTAASREASAATLEQKLRAPGLTEAFLEEFRQRITTAAGTAPLTTGATVTAIQGDMMAIREALQTAERPVLLTRLNLMMSSDGRMLMARAEAGLSRGAGIPTSNIQNFIHVSVPAGPDEDSAMRAWLADDMALLRQRSREAAGALATMVQDTFLTGAAAALRDGPLHEVIGANFFTDVSPRSGPPRGEYLLRDRDLGRILQSGPDRMLVRIDRAGVWPLADLPVLRAAPTP